MTNTATRGSPAPTYHDSKAHVIRNLVIFDVVGEPEKMFFFGELPKSPLPTPSPNLGNLNNAQIGDLTGIQKLK